MKIKELIKRWEATGLLEGMTKNKERAELSHLLENSARYLIDEDEISEDICAVMLPCIRKIYDMDNSVVFDFKFLHEILDHCLSNMIDVEKVHAIDAEAEATSLACDYFVSEQNNKKLKQNLIKKYRS